MRELAKKTGMDFNTQIKELEEKYDQVRQREIYVIPSRRDKERITERDRNINTTFGKEVLSKLLWKCLTFW